MAKKEHHFYDSPFSTALVFLTAFTWIWFWSGRYSMSAALANDAQNYFQSAADILAGTRSPLLTDVNGATFSDVGYPNFLAIGFSIFGASVKIAQILNAALWGGSCIFLYSILKTEIASKRALFFSVILASSPTLTSFGGKIYSEHLAIFAGVLCFWSAYRGVRWSPLFALGGFLLVVTKSAFFFLFPIIFVGCILRRNFAFCVAALAVVAFALPIQIHLQRGARGAIQVAAQTAKLDLLNYSTVLRCSAYNLSTNLGERIFPEVEGACRVNAGGLNFPLQGINYEELAIRRVKDGFTYDDGVRIILKSPFKYVLIGITTLFSAVWIEGLYPDAVKGIGPRTRIVFWLLKVGYSTLLWIGVLLFFKTAIEGPLHRRIAFLIAIPFVFIFLFQMNVPAEQRYFFPLIPLLYLANALYLGGSQRNRIKSIRSFFKKKTLVAR